MATFGYCTAMAYFCKACKAFAVPSSFIVTCLLSALGLAVPTAEFRLVARVLLAGPVYDKVHALGVLSGEML